MTTTVDGKDILIIDDDLDIRIAIGEALETLGEVTIRGAGNGNEAIKMVETQCPDLIILDQMLPGRSGFPVLEKIKPLQGDKKVPVIMITANPGARHKVYAESLGVETYLNKPFRMDRLTEAVETLLAPDDE